MALSIQLAAATKYNYESAWVKITTAQKNLAKSSKDQQGPAAKGKQGGKAGNQAVQSWKRSNFCKSWDQKPIF